MPTEIDDFEASGARRARHDLQHQCDLYEQQIFKIRRALRTAQKELLPADPESFAKVSAALAEAIFRIEEGIFAEQVDPGDGARLRVARSETHVPGGSSAGAVPEAGDV